MFQLMHKLEISAWIEFCMHEETLHFKTIYIGQESFDILAHETQCQNKESFFGGLWR